jgi:hypothetical protein
VTLIQTGRLLTFTSGYREATSMRVYDTKRRLLAHLVLRTP